MQEGRHDFPSADRNHARPVRAPLDLNGTRLARALRAFIRSGDRGQLWNSAHHLVYFLFRTGRSGEALRIWRELGSRRAYVSQHYRDELTRLIGPPGEGTLSDDELIVQILEVLDRLDH